MNGRLGQDHLKRIIKVLELEMCRAIGITSVKWWTVTGWWGTVSVVAPVTSPVVPRSFPVLEHVGTGRCDRGLPAGLRMVALLWIHRVRQTFYRHPEGAEHATSRAAREMTTYASVVEISRKQQQCTESRSA